MDCSRRSRSAKCFDEPCPSHRWRLCQADVCPFNARSACAAQQILLLVEGSRQERWTHLALYERWFWGVLHLPHSSPDAERCRHSGVACLLPSDLPQRCFHGGGSPIEGSMYSNSTCSTCGDGAADQLYWGFPLHVFENHRRTAHVLRCVRERCAEPWLGRLQQQARRPLLAVQGVLYAHMDLWVLPYAIAADAPLSTVWRLNNGAGGTDGALECTNGSSADRSAVAGRLRHVLHRNWWCNSTRAAWEAMAEVEEAGLLPTSWPAAMLCPGWSDLFYIPLGLSTLYSALSDIFWRHHVPNEVSTHTILHLLAMSDQSSVEPRGSEHVVRCVGGAEASIRPDLIRRRACGHRLDFTNAELVAAFTSALQVQGEHGEIDCEDTRPANPRESREKAKRYLVR